MRVGSCHNKQPIVSGMRCSLAVISVSLFLESIGANHGIFAWELEPAACKLEYYPVAWVTIEDNGCNAASAIDECWQRALHVGALEKKSVDDGKAAGKKMGRINLCMADWVCDPYNKWLICMDIAPPHASKFSKNLQARGVGGE